MASSWPDCVGAVQLLPPGIAPEGFDQLRYAVLTTEQVENHLGNLGSRVGVGAQDDDENFRLSITGTQEKTALLQVNGQWCRPLGATPTTHILKPPIGVTAGRNLDLRLSVENEWLCNQIVRTLGLPASARQIQDFGARRALVVTRFDRSWQPQGWIARLPQEDFCQAKGVSRDQKYEQKGGPGIEACLEVLQRREAFHEDGRNLLCAQLLFWLLAAMAVHGKTAHYKLSEIQYRHWQALAQRSAVDGAWDAMLAMIDRLDAVLTSIAQRLPADFPIGLAQFYKLRRSS